MHITNNKPVKFRSDQKIGQFRWDLHIDKTWRKQWFENSIAVTLFNYYFTLFINYCLWLNIVAGLTFILLFLRFYVAVSFSNIFQFCLAPGIIRRKYILSFYLSTRCNCLMLLVMIMSLKYKTFIIDQLINGHVIPHSWTEAYITSIHKKID